MPKGPSKELRKISEEEGVRQMIKKGLVKAPGKKLKAFPFGKSIKRKRRRRRK